jgi:hypothetical protein
MNVVRELSVATTTALRIGNASKWQNHPLTNSIKVVHASVNMIKIRIKSNDQGLRKRNEIRL